jgi:hypothetical protein
MDDNMRCISLRPMLSRLGSGIAECSRSDAIFRLLSGREQVTKLAAGGCRRARATELYPAEYRTFKKAKV